MIETSPIPVSIRGMEEILEQNKKSSKESGEYPALFDNSLSLYLNK